MVKRWNKKTKNRFTRNFIKSIKQVVPDTVYFKGSFEVWVKVTMMRVYEFRPETRITLKKMICHVLWSYYEILPYDFDSIFTLFDIIMRGIYHRYNPVIPSMFFKSSFFQSGNQTHQQYLTNCINFMVYYINGKSNQNFIHTKFTKFQYTFKCEFTAQCSAIELFNDMTTRIGHLNNDLKLIILQLL